LTASDAVPLRLFSLALPNLKAFEGFDGLEMDDGFEGFDGFVGETGFEGDGLAIATAQVEKWPATPLKRTTAGVPLVGCPFESSFVTATQPSALGAAPPAQSGKAR
jgi:hypothetical protein